MGHNWPLLHYVATALGLLARLVPKPYRFTAARWLAFALHPLIARTQMCRQQVAMGLDTSREIALFVVLRFLTRAGCQFDVPVRHKGGYRGEPGALVACAHTTLCYVMARYLSDKGLDPVVVEAAPNALIGTRRFPRAAISGPGLLKRCEDHLTNGDTLWVMLDRAEPTKRTKAVPLTARPLHVGTPLFDHAERIGCPVVFCTARVDRKFNVVLTWRRAPAKEMFAEFGRFLCAELPSQHLGHRSRATDDAPRAVREHEIGGLAHVGERDRRAA